MNLYGTVQFYSKKNHFSVVAVSGIRAVFVYIPEKIYALTPPTPLRLSLGKENSPYLKEKRILQQFASAVFPPEYDIQIHSNFEPERRGLRGRQHWPPRGAVLGRGAREEAAPGTHRAVHFPHFFKKKLNIHTQDVCGKGGRGIFRSFHYVQAPPAPLSRPIAANSASDAPSAKARSQRALMGGKAGRRRRLNEQLSLLLFPLRPTSLLLRPSVVFLTSLCLADFFGGAQKMDSPFFLQSRFRQVPSSVSMFFGSNFEIFFSHVCRI